MTTVARYNGNKIENIINESSPTTYISKSKPKPKPNMSTTTTLTQTQQAPIAQQAPPVDSKVKKTAYEKFMDAHRFDKKNKPTDPAASITNTRIGDKKGVKGGNWYIPDGEYYQFLDLYYRDIIQTGANEYLTEYQLPEGGPILIDVDLRHSFDIKTRQYQQKHLDSLVKLSAQILCDKVYQLDDEDHFQIYLLEKPTVNVVEKDKLTKDGVHLMIGVKSNPTVQQFLRQHMLKAIAEDPDWASLPITNSWDAVLDAGISGGKTNWQLYGSRKPDHQAYSLTAIYEVWGDTENNLKQVSLNDFPLVKNIQRLSARYAHHPEFYHRSAYIQHVQGLKRAGPSSSSASAPAAAATVTTTNTTNEVKIPANSKAAFVSTIIPVEVPIITSKEGLDAWVNSFLEINELQYEVQDIYKFVMALPESYYGHGSYEKWFRVGCALKNHDNALFSIWVAFSSQSPTFDWFSGVQELWNKWNGMNQHDRLTMRSIKYWCRQENPEQYKTICDESADQLIESSLNTLDAVKGVQGMSHNDIATILYHLKKNEYVCSSVKSKEWYKYNDNYWEKSEEGTDLRKFISDSNGLRGIYYKKLSSILREKAKITQEDERKEMLDNRMKLIQTVIQKLGDANMKNNIMIEARELFYDAFFKDKLDTNKDLLCVKNGVLDFKEKVFRRGNPEDYLSMCTRSNYIPIQRVGLAKDYYDNPAVVYENMSAKKQGFVAMDSRRCWVSGATDVITGAEGIRLLDETVADIHDFMEKIFTEPELREYMWQHLSSCLLGYTNQTFSMYIGKGSNGKSVLTKLMSDILGDYKGDVPLTLITEKRQKVGGLAPEIADLKGVRFALIQESSKGDALNEGIMKQLTSGVDVVQGRGLFQPSATKFYPQFKLAICSNEMLEVRSQDGGTWRRIRKIEYKSKFTDNPDPNNPREFKKISEIAMHHKMNDFWKSVFLSMLAEVAFKTMGQVEACSIVEEASRSYQESLDFMIGFMRDCVEVSEGGRITKTEINDEFARWFRLNNGGREPKPKEIHQQMDERYGKYDGRKGWMGVRLKHIIEEEDDGEPDVEF